MLCKALDFILMFSDGSDPTVKTTTKAPNQTTTTSIQTTTTTMKTRDTPDDSTTPALVAGSVSAGVVLVLGAVLAVVCACRRRRMNSESETAEDDVNPVYATYEIHDDPVAEERPQFFSIFQTFLRITHFIPWYTIPLTPRCTTGTQIMI